MTLFQNKHQNVSTEHRQQWRTIDSIVEPWHSGSVMPITRVVNDVMLRAATSSDISIPSRTKYLGIKFSSYAVNHKIDLFGITQMMTTTEMLLLMIMTTMKMLLMMAPIYWTDLSEPRSLYDVILNRLFRICMTSFGHFIWYDVTSYYRIHPREPRRRWQTTCLTEARVLNFNREKQNDVVLAGFNWSSPGETRNLRLNEAASVISADSPTSFILAILRWWVSSLRHVVFTNR